MRLFSGPEFSSAQLSVCAQLLGARFLHGCLGIPTLLLTGQVQVQVQVQIRKATRGGDGRGGDRHGTVGRGDWSDRGSWTRSRHPPLHFTYRLMPEL